jgi:3-deoxy-D-manno-octulosonic acid kinase
MMKDGGRRIATSSGAMLADPASLGNLLETAAEALFEPQFWAAHGELIAVTAGRGAAWFIASGARQWVLRHGRRGGFIARLLRDRYVWAGENRVRAFAEWRLLAYLTERGLPVPKPIAARYRRSGPIYRCDLITQRIPNARSLSSMLALASLSEERWRAVGATVANLHRASVDHVDLNAHNILMDPHGVVSVIDFDRGRLRRHGTWAARNVARLRRSLEKVARDLPSDRFSGAAWDWFLAGYASTPASPDVKTPAHPRVN